MIKPQIAMMKHVMLSLGLLTTMAVAHAQPTTLSLEECQQAAEQNYPLVKQRELIAKSREYAVENVATGKLPQVVITGQASYQSDVTRLPIALPGQDAPLLPKDQYRLSGEITQPLTDIVTVHRQQAAQEVSADIQEQTLEVELYKLRDRVNQVYFGALLIDEQYQQNELLKKDLRIGIDRTTALWKNGTEYQSSVDKLQAELLKADQRSIELQASRKAYLDMLALFMNRELSDSTVLQRPQAVALMPEVNRPELKLYDFQQRSYAVQETLLNARNLPKFSLFFQGGIGKPTPANMLETSFTPYYITGLRLNWNLSSFYTSARERQVIAINQRIVDTQRESFLFNTQLTLRQQHTEIGKLQALVERDDEIIRLRTSVKQASNAQLENGVITVNDFLREVNAEDQARQNKLLHETQLLMAQYNYQNTTGNGR